MPLLFKPHLNKKIKSSYKGGKSRSEVQSDKPLHKLNANENILGPSPLAVQAIRQHTHLLNEYPERTGRSLQLALDHFYQNQLTPDQFITANSGMGIIELITQAFLDHDLECILSSPAFGAYANFARKVGAKAIDIPLRGENYSLDIQSIVDAISDNTRIIWINSPNNPTGSYVPKIQIDELISRIPDHVVLVCDEVYSHFATAPDFCTALPYVLAGKNIIAVNSFSKTYGLAGMRIGYAYSTAEIADYINRIRRPFLLDRLSLVAAQAALKDTAFIRKTRQTIREGKAFLYPKLDELGIKYWKSQANFIMIKPEMKDKIFEQKMLEKGIMIRLVANFGAEGCARVTIGTQEINSAFVEALKNIL